MKPNRRHRSAIGTIALASLLGLIVLVSPVRAQTVNESALGFEVTISEKVDTNSPLGSGWTSQISDTTFSFAAADPAARSVQLEPNLVSVSVSIQPSDVAAVELRLQPRGDSVSGAPGQAVTLRNVPTDRSLEVVVTPTDESPQTRWLHLSSLQCHDGLDYGRVAIDGDSCVILRRVIVAVADGYTVDDAVSQFEALAGWEVATRLDGLRVIVGRHVPDNLSLSDLQYQAQFIGDQPWASSAEPDGLATAARLVEPPPEDETAQATGNGTPATGDGDVGSSGGVTNGGNGGGSGVSNTGDDRGGSGVEQTQADPTNAVVYLANGWSPADIGVASVLAARIPAATVAFTSAESLSANTMRLIRELRPARVVAVGGTLAVTAQALTAVRSASEGTDTDRVSGGNRALTAAAAARRVLGDASAAGDVTLVVANGWSPSDVGVAAALAARTSGAVVAFTATHELSAATAELLDEYRVGRVIVIGGTSAVSESVQAAIAAAAVDATTDRVSGGDRALTAAAAARRVLGDASAAGSVTLVVANGWSPPDVGVAAALAARTPGAAVAFTAAHELSGATAELLAEYRPDRVVIIGGTSAVSDAVRDAIAAAVPVDAEIERIAGMTRIDTAAASARLALRE